ncbi:MAG: helix-turn-helix domain-containing protein [Pseudomonadales bacterium]
MLVHEVVAIRLKALRAERGWSLSETASRTEVSKAMLGQIERRESSPTLSTLWKICQGFSLPLSSLLAPQPLPDQTHPIDDTGISFSTLFPFDERLGTEMFALTLQPNTKHASKAHIAGVIEDIIVTHGELEIHLADKREKVSTGGVYRFAADKPHAYVNSGEVPVSFHNVIHYPVWGAMHRV